jgi:hypothetical protein
MGYENISQSWTLHQNDEVKDQKLGESIWKDSQNVSKFLNSAQTFILL